MFHDSLLIPTVLYNVFRFFVVACCFFCFFLFIWVCCILLVILSKRLMCSSSFFSSFFSSFCLSLGYTCGAFHPDGLLYSAGTTASVLRVWDTKAGRLASSLTGHAAAVRSVSFSENGYVRVVIVCLLLLLVLLLLLLLFTTLVFVSFIIFSYVILLFLMS